jgi:MFS family permease
MTVGADVVSMCMTATTSNDIDIDRTEVLDVAMSTRSLRERLRPLYVGSALQGVVLWVPVEKLFMKGLGFSVAQMGIVAACYAAVVPFLEIPSGILADRRSRLGVLIAADVALAASSLAGGLSTGVGSYVVAAFLLGTFFALQSGTVDSIIYDTVVEETGSSDGFERAIGRLHVWQSAALVTSALAGGALAAITSARLTYYVTVPFVLASVCVLRRFREPITSRAGEREPVREQIATTYRTLLAHGPIRPVIAATVGTSVLLQAVFEFGPLWMLAVAAPAFLYGPQWAGLMASSGIGGTIAGRVDMNRPATVRTAAALLVGFALTLVISDRAVILIAAQVGMAIVLVGLGVHLNRQLHDQIPSTIRAGVSSGVGTLTWITFLPFALVFGFVTSRCGIRIGGWIFVGAATMAAAAVLSAAARVSEAEPDALTSSAELAADRQPTVMTTPRSP